MQSQANATLPRISLLSVEEAALLINSSESATALNPLIIVDVHVLKKHIDDGHSTVSCIPGAMPVGLDELEVPFVEVHPPDSHKKRKREDLKYKDGNLIDDTELRKRVEAIGITRDTTVLAYSTQAEHGALPTARFLWALAYCGVKDLRFLDGGLQLWTHRGYEVSNEWATRTPQTSFFPWKQGGACSEFPSCPGVLSSTEDVMRVVHARQRLKEPTDNATEPEPDNQFGCGESQIPILGDVRSHEEYIGASHEYTYFDALGRIPHAVWTDWGPSTYTGGAYTQLSDAPGVHILKPLEEIRNAWQARGVDGSDGQPVIFYCGSGWRSSLAWLISRLLGWSRTSNYDGGWLEWSTLHPNAGDHPNARGEFNDDPV